MKTVEIYTWASWKIKAQPATIPATVTTGGSNVAVAVQEVGQRSIKVRGPGDAVVKARPIQKKRKVRKNVPAE